MFDLIDFTTKCLLSIFYLSLIYKNHKMFLNLH